MEVEKGRQSERERGESLTTERREQMQENDGYVRGKRADSVEKNQA